MLACLRFFCCVGFRLLNCGSVWLILCVLGFDFGVALRSCVFGGLFGYFGCCWCCLLVGLLFWDWFVGFGVYVCVCDLVFWFVLVVASLYCGLVFCYTLSLLILVVGLVILWVGLIPYCGLCGFVLCVYCFCVLCCVVCLSLLSGVASWWGLF